MLSNKRFSHLTPSKDLNIEGCDVNRPRVILTSFQWCTTATDKIDIEVKEESANDKATTNRKLCMCQCIEWCCSTQRWRQECPTGGLKYGFQGTIDAENLRKNSFFDFIFTYLNRVEVHSVNDWFTMCAVNVKWKTKLIEIILKCCLEY